MADWFTRSYAECGAVCEGVDPLGPCAKDGEVARESPGKLRKIVRCAVRADEAAGLQRAAKP